MGVHFDTASRKIGRQRLPSGLVAILDDAAALRGAIEELHDYANNNHEPTRPRMGIVFRVVSANEQTGFMHKLCDRFGSDVSQHDGMFSIPV
jgi:hypothetical protein